MLVEQCRSRLRQPTAEARSIVAPTLRCAALYCCFLPTADHRTKNNYDLNKVLEGGIDESIQVRSTRRGAVLG